MFVLFTLVGDLCWMVLLRTDISWLLLKAQSSTCQYIKRVPFLGYKRNLVTHSTKNWGLFNITCY